jgi:hypothetical protein
VLYFQIEKASKLHFLLKTLSKDVPYRLIYLLVFMISVTIVNFNHNMYSQRYVEFLLSCRFLCLLFGIIWQQRRVTLNKT